MNKSELQKELQEKIKEGIKPSDLKRNGKLSEKPISKTKEDEGYESDKSDKSIPTPPPPPNNQLLSLQKKIEIQEAIKKADEKIKKEQQEQIKNLEDKLKTLIKLASQEKTEHQQTIKDLQAKIAVMNKTIEELKNQGVNPTKTKETSPEKEPKYYLFTCDICEQNKRSKLHLGKVNGLGIDPNKENKICDWCINKVDLIKTTEKDYKWE